jgi:hypothetical protein
MIRTLLATTAVAAVLALPVFAQDASSSMSSMDSSMMSSEMPMDSSAMDSSMMSSEAPADSSMMSTESSAMADTSSAEVVTDASSMMSSMEPAAPFDIVTGYTQIDSDNFATRIIGQPVYDGTAADANHLGDINDIVLGQNGQAQAVIIGVGGFLGIGEKQVAVAFSALTRQMAEDNTERYVVETTVDELTAAPDFVVVDDGTGDVEAPVSGDATAAPAGDAMAPAPAEGDAMAPAPAEGDAMAPSSAAQ